MSGSYDGRSRSRVRRLVQPGRRPARLTARTVDLDEYGDPVGPDVWTGSAPVPREAEPETWTGAAAVPGPEAAGWTRPYGVETEPEPRARRRYSLGVVLAVGLGAVVLFVVAALPVLHRLGFGFGSGTQAPKQTTSAGAGAATFQTLTIEAEAPDNTLTGSARIGAYQGASGGRLVRAIGTWGGNKGPGALRFSNVVVPATGTYVVTFYFVNIQGRATRTAILTTTGGDSATVAVTGNNSVCCDTKQVQLQLQQGSNGITFANPGGEAPAIDRITVAMA